MRVSKQRLDVATGIAARGVALLSILAVLASCLTVFAVANAQQKRSRKQTRLTEEQRILHVLNRLGFGARPGDIERVKAMGLENYINQQLNPEKITDSLADAKTKNLSTLSM